MAGFAPLDHYWLALPVGNEGINLYVGILGIHSLIPY